MKRALSLGLLAITLGSPLAARATPADAPAAEQLFREGRAAFDHGDFAGARARFAESQRLDGAPGTLLNLAMAEDKLGDLSHAWEHAKGALDALPSSDERQSIARHLFEELDRRVPRLRVTLAEGAPAGTRVMRDEVELREGSLGVALPIDAGEHVIVVSAHGRTERRFVVTAREGELAQLVVSPGPATDGAPAAPARVSAARSPMLGYVIGGTGLAALAVGGFAGVMVLKKKSDVDSHCDGARVCDAAAFDAASQGKTWSAVSTVGFAAGAVLTTVGVILVLSSGPSGDASVTAHVGPGGISSRFSF